MKRRKSKNARKRASGVPLSDSAPDQQPSRRARNLAAMDLQRATPRPRPRRAPPGPLAAFECFDDLLTWLDTLGLDLETAESTIRRACGLLDEGCTPQQIVYYFGAEHNVAEEDRWRIGEFAAFVAYRGRIRRGAGGRFLAPRESEKVTALVSVPLDKWEAVKPFVHRGRGAWIGGEPA